MRLDLHLFDCCLSIPLGVPFTSTFMCCPLEGPFKSCLLDFTVPIIAEEHNCLSRRISQMVLVFSCFTLPSDASNCTATGKFW